MYICRLTEELSHGSEDDLTRLCIKGAWRFNTSLKLDSHFFQAILGSLVDSISCQGIFCNDVTIKICFSKMFKITHFSFNLSTRGDCEPPHNID